MTTKKSIWAIADLHLSFGVPNKSMDVFGPQWNSHTKKIESAWRSQISEDDLILIAGDISWAMRLEDVVPDLEWIHSLPGTKVFIKGNHDYWWGSLSKIKAILPSSCHLIQNSSFSWNGVSVAGTRLWDLPQANFSSVIDFQTVACVKPLTEVDNSDESEKIFARELSRLETSLKLMDPNATLKIAMTHYPPINLQLEDNEVTKLLEKYHVDMCIFGHLHRIKEGMKLFGEHKGIEYHLVACDYLKDFAPICLAKL